MVFKELVALLVNNDGVYSCSKDLNAEIDLYHTVLKLTQQGVDRARELNPDWSEARLQEYASGGTFGSVLPKIKDCLDSIGYDTSSLPHVVVPEFPVPGMAGLITAGAMGAGLAYMKLKNRFYKNKESENK